MRRACIISMGTAGESHTPESYHALGESAAKPPQICESAIIILSVYPNAILNLTQAKLSGNNYV